MTDNGDVPAGCLQRAQIRSIAAGRGTEKELAVVRQHLAECGRCRAAVAARAGGVPGPGETVVLTQAARVAPLPIPIKLAAVAMSLVVVIGAWRYAAAPPSAKPEVPSTLTDGLAAAEPFRMTPPPPVSQSPGVIVPSTMSESTPSDAMPVSPASAPDSQPLETTAPQPDSAPTVVGDAGIVQTFDSTDTEPATAPTRRRGRLPRDQSAPSVRGTSPSPADDEFDFGIDEPPPTRPTVAGRAIRTTLD
jgi:hypothetical protein